MPTLLDARIFVGLGSNLGDADSNITRALSWLSSHPRLELLRHTGTIRTAPWGVTDQPEFSNAVAELRTDLSPHELLAELKQAEILLGRTPGPRWGPRMIDLDILLFGDMTLRSDILDIPHPRLIERAFVIAQLVELDPYLCLPPDSVPLRQFL